ncbi:unnamed protein product [Pedinophyceae sp. YPF-701]|nr:unnamed protein product [Pedinophyceae sp. YPF-701]
MLARRVVVAAGRAAAAPAAGAGRVGVAPGVRPCVRAAASAAEVDASEKVEEAAPAHLPAFRAALDFKFFRDNVELLQRNADNRNAACDVARVAELYSELVALQQENDALRAKRNENAKSMKGKMEQEQRMALVEEGKQLKARVAEVEARLEEVDQELQAQGQRIPNLTHPDVPVGGESEAVLMAEIGAKKDFGFEAKDHVAIGEALGAVEFDAASEVSGSKFYYLKGAGAMLEVALTSWTMSRLVAKGFMPYTTPDLVRSHVVERCGFQPRADNTQVYKTENSDLCLAGTAEIPLGGLYMNKILREDELPIRMCGIGHCFRTEAGAAGAAGKGLYRVHQFSKVEMFVISTPEQSEALHQELIEIEKELFTELGLHFKVLDMPSGDLGAPAYRKVDVEAWMPGLARYGEISSASNCTDYQARRLNIRYRPGGEEGDEAEEGNGKKKGKKGKKDSGRKTMFVHTLNGTGCAVPRMIVAILENFQQEDGSVVVPEVLRPYLGMDVIRPS